MSTLQEFSYSDIFQRRIIYYNTILTSIVCGIIISDITFSMTGYLFYFPVLKTVLLCVLAGIFAGNLFGRLVFERIDKSRVIYIIVEAVFIILSVFYTLRAVLFKGEQPSMLFFFNFSEYSILIFSAVISFFAGMKINYFLKISCGDFIDEKQGIIKFVSFFAFGFPLGMILSALLFFWLDPVYGVSSFWFTVFPVIIIPTLFIIRLPFNPVPIYARHYREEAEEKIVSDVQKKDLLFTYFNFGYIIIYVYLGFISIIKFYGDIFQISLLFLGICFLFVYLGLILGRVVKTSVWHIYTQMFFPLAFFVFFFLLIQFNSVIPWYYAVAAFALPLFVFGFAVNHTLSNIMIHFDHNRRFQIIDLSLLILPLPVLFALSCITFTSALYYSFLYFVAVLNVIVPGIFLLNRDVRPVKKILYFVFSLFFIPLIIFINLYFKIPFDSSLFVKKTENFEELKKVNYGSSYIKRKISVKMKGDVVFKLSDTVVRNMKRAIMPVWLFHDNEKPVLFIDGNQRFFRNPCFQYFETLNILDPVSDENVDYQNLPVTGDLKYVAESAYLPVFLQKNRKKFFTVADIPNLLDQKNNFYRFTGEYFRSVKKHIMPGGIYVQICNLDEMRSEFLYSTVKNLKEAFEHHVVFLYSNILVVLSSDNKDNFIFDRSKYLSVSRLYNSRKELEFLFYNEGHLLSHLLFDEIDDLLPFIQNRGIDRLFFLEEPKKLKIDQEMYYNYEKNNRKILSFLNPKSADWSFGSFLAKKLYNEDTVLSLLKKTELAESREDYEDETHYLFQLNNLTSYRYDLRRYMQYVLSYKEEHYFNAALRLEKQKKWEDARKLYRSILTINRNNFDANYRMGLLCLTLQDIDNSFTYLQNAMRLRKNHPKVLHQMGILLFSRGDYREAVSYLEKVLSLREDSASVYLYLGFSHEELGNLKEAHFYYSKALIKDPNDVNIKARLENIGRIQEEERKKYMMPSRKNQLEEEVNEEVPLPINKSAYDIRLDD